MEVQCRIPVRCRLTASHSVLIVTTLEITADALLPDFEQPCPAGWTLDHENYCIAPGSYKGHCVGYKRILRVSLRETVNWGPVFASLPMPHSLCTSVIQPQSAELHGHSVCRLLTMF